MDVEPQWVSAAKSRFFGDLPTNCALDGGKNDELLEESAVPPPGFHPAAIDPQALRPAPIDPGWIIAGEPRARAVELARSPDGTCTSALWDCTAGVFHWYFWNEETVHILEGSVRVRDRSGREFTLKPGDVANLPANQWMVWHVEEYVRKLAHCRYPVPRPFGRLVRMWQGLRTRFGLKRARAGHPLSSSS